MPDRTQTSRPPARRPLRSRPGFSFVEVLFAVIILGVGFILVAAIFPVAIQQTQATAEDAAAAAAAREAANAITGLPTAATNPLYVSTATAAQIAANPPIGIPQLLLFPPTVKKYIAPSAGVVGSAPPPAIVVPFTGRAWEVARGNAINPSDPRYAFVPFYKRENGSPVAQLIVVAVTARNRPVYNLSVDAALPSNYSGPAGVVTAGAVTTQTAVADTTGLYTVYPDSITFASPPLWVGEGCTVPTYTTTGRSYRLGRALSAATPPVSFELDAGDGASMAPGKDGLWGTKDDVVDTTANPNGVVPTSTLQPVGAYAAVYTAPGSLAGRITLSTNIGYAVGAATGNAAPAAAVPGTFVIVADDYPYDPTSAATAIAAKYTVPLNNSATNPNLVVGALNGHVFRLGQPVPANSTSTPIVPPGTFELDPQFPMPPIVTTATGTTLIPITASGPRARVFLVGEGRANALSTNDTTTAQETATLTTYTGPAQDTGVFSTFFPVQ